MIYSSTQMSHAGIIFDADSQFQVRFLRLWLFTLSRNKVGIQPLQQDIGIRMGICTIKKMCTLITIPYVHIITWLMYKIRKLSQLHTNIHASLHTNSLKDCFTIQLKIKFEWKLRKWRMLRKNKNGQFDTNWAFKLLELTYQNYNLVNCNFVDFQVQAE